MYDNSPARILDSDRCQRLQPDHPQSGLLGETGNRARRLGLECVGTSNHDTAVRYGSLRQRVTISVEPNKFQVVDGLPDRRPDASQIPKVARRYIEVLPHVRYTAVGHNFKGFAELADARAFLTERFLKPGVWDSDKYPLKGVSLKFAYPLEGGRLNLTLDGAIIEDRSGDEPKSLHGVLVQPNYHRDCSGYPSHEQAIEHLGHTKEDWIHFQLTASEILG